MLRRALLAAALAAAAGEPEWKREFEDICAKTQDAMSLPSEELRALLDRCDRLKPRVEALEPSERKVYARRLQMCRDLYAFVLETRK